jgi:addiction module HigA family antidote
MVSPPGETLMEAIEMRGMTQTDLAARTGRTPKLINEIIKGKAPITADTALQLERVLGVSAEFWNNRERQYREALSRRDEGQQLADAVGWLRRFPLGAMSQLGWIRKRKDNVDQLRELLNYFGVASPKAWEDYWSQMQVSYRKSTAFNADLHALRAWLRKGEVEGQSLECAAYDATAFRRMLGKIRALTVEEPQVFQPRLIEWCAACGVAVAFVPELPKIRASGAMRWLTPTKALIQVNLRYKKDDHFWFTVFHEAGHMLNDSKKMLFVDTERFEGEYEDAANRFAAEQLVPQAALTAFAVSKRHLSKMDIVSFARRQGVAPGIVVGQLQHRKKLQYAHCNDLKRTFVWA